MIPTSEADLVRRAIERSDPLPGTAGFAGEVDGTLVRDVLGRYPLFVEAADPTDWAHCPTELRRPQQFEAGHLRSLPSEAPAERHWSLPTLEGRSDTSIIGDLREAIDTTLQDIEIDDLAIGFSGGIDSAILASKLDCPLFTVGFPGAHDIEAARSTAAELDADLRVIELDHSTLEDALSPVVTATGRTNAMDVTIAVGLYILSEHVAAAGFDRLALGQGADELFGGYAKVAKASEDDRVTAESIRGARDETIQTLPDQFERDRLAVGAGGVEAVTPLAHDRIVRLALALRGDQIVRAGRRKWALREAATPWLPQAVCDREKKAFQYGTYVSRELDRLARQAGFKRRMDDHVTQYIEHMV